MRYVKLAILVVSIGTSFVAYSQKPAKTGPKASLTAGKELFHQRCSVCHGVDGRGPGPGLNVRSRNQAIRQDGCHQLI